MQASSGTGMNDYRRCLVFWRFFITAATRSASDDIEAGDMARRLVLDVSPSVGRQCQSP
jgi:hypothetical protein